MSFQFPTGPFYKKEKDPFDWWGIGLLLPYVFVGDTANGLGIDKEYIITAPSHIKYIKNDFFYSFEIRLLGFGFWFSKQWGY